MLEMGGITAGTAVGSAAGKAVSDGIDKTLRKTDNVLKKAAKQGAPPAGVPAPPPPALQVSTGVPRTSGGYNVPPPPPPTKKTVPPPPRTPVRATRVTVPIVRSAVAPPPEPVDVDLSAIATGMKRDQLLSLGEPAARITSTEEGYLIEIFSYHNVNLASGKVRLRDGAVASVEARP